MDLEADRRSFDEQGFIGPFALCEPEEMTRFWRKQRATLLDPDAPSRQVFDNPVNYDRHLDVDGLSELISSSPMVRRMQAIVGPDIQCWRTEFFPKNPGDAGTGWHQVETYAIGEAEEGMLEATQRSEEAPMELTAWVALTEATRDNGCMKLLPGSHKKWAYDEKRRMEFDDSRRDNTFFGYDYSELRLDKSWNPDDEEAFHAEMRPGEAIIFTARCIHGSNPNTSRKQRMGFAIRVVPSHVRVYGGMTEFHEFGHLFDLKKHGCVQIAGVDDFGHNTVRTKNEWGTPFTTLSRSA